MNTTHPVVGTDTAKMSAALPLLSSIDNPTALHTLLFPSVEQMEQRLDEAKQRVVHFKQEAYDNDNVMLPCETRNLIEQARQDDREEHRMDKQESPFPAWYNKTS